MKTDYKFIKFRKCVIDEDFEYTCFTIKGDILGSVAYYPKWKQYEFVPMMQTGWSYQ